MTEADKRFKKIEVDCTTQFFDEGGQVIVWYGKNSKKEYEFFSSLGLNPETGKTLKPVTTYMITKYVCPDY